MPGMDGVEALSWFRRGSNTRFTFLTPSDTPVIAVTANALEGDEQRFLDVGFDDYLSKPFRQSQLQKVLIEHTRPEGWADQTESGEAAAGDANATRQPSAAATNPATEVATETTAKASAPGATRSGAVADAPPSASSPAAPSVAASTQPPGTELFDVDALRRLRDLDPRGENRLFERVSKAFEASASRLLPQLDEAIRVNDRAAIVHVAHTLKSSSASIGALKLSHLCAEIETMIRRQSEEDLSERLRAVPVEVEHVLAGLRALLEQSP
jgi:CheY-like chemotaxis protein